VLVVWGRHDPYLPVSYAGRQREFFPQAQVKILEDSGHWPFADNNERVAEIFMPFIRQAVSVSKA